MDHASGIEKVNRAVGVLGLLLACMGAPARAADDTNLTIDPAIARESAEVDAKAKSDINHSAKGSIVSADTSASEGASASEGPRTPYEKALLNYKAGKYEAAKLLIEDADEGMPGNAPIEMLKVRILAELHDFRGAHQTLNSLYDRFDLTPTYTAALVLTTGDLNLRERHFEEASKSYDQYLLGQPADEDAKLKLIYARLSVGDLVKAGKLASELKPTGATPAYYFAHAALVHAGAATGDEDQDFQQARTIYGITLTNAYLKTYLEVFATDKAAPGKPGAPKPAPSGKAQ